MSFIKTLINIILEPVTFILVQSFQVIPSLFLTSLTNDSIFSSFDYLNNMAFPQEKIPPSFTISLTNRYIIYLSIEIIVDLINLLTWFRWHHQLYYIGLFFTLRFPMKLILSIPQVIQYIFYFYQILYEKGYHLFLQTAAHLVNKLSLEIFAYPAYVRISEIETLINNFRRIDQEKLKSLVKILVTIWISSYFSFWSQSKSVNHDMIIWALRNRNWKWFLTNCSKLQGFRLKKNPYKVVESFIGRSLTIYTLASFTKFPLLIIGLQLLFLLRKRTFSLFILLRLLISLMFSLQGKYLLAVVIYEILQFITVPPIEEFIYTLFSRLKSYTPIRPETMTFLNFFFFTSLIIPIVNYKDPLMIIGTTCLVMNFPRSHQIFLLYLIIFGALSNYTLLHTLTLTILYYSGWLYYHPLYNPIQFEMIEDYL